ncbi:Ig-like domain-containing protein [Nocardioides sp. SYSU D00065]|uniref:Ig-like domain-containing protein n=1 Tax=Nocardioides sp. SYSU D00065 TaxID=2817378 RepID=UPI001B32DE10|nr:Ig-like domain-containing protein [Nocardioides sp. SYSU D00065]
MPLRHRLAGATALTLAASLPTAFGAPAHAGAFGPGETIVSGTTTPAGAGESVVAALPDGRTLVVWEGARTVTTGTAQGIKREIFGRLLDVSGAAVGSPVLLARMGGVDDATTDATDPAVATLPDGRVALVFAGDTIADKAGAPTPNDLTGWQIQHAVIDPSALGLVAPTPVTAVAPGDAAYDQQHPDVAMDHGVLRVVWDGDTPATGEGQTHVWTAQLPLDPATVPTAVRVSPAAPAGAAYDHARPRVASASTGSRSSVVVWEGVTALDGGAPLRRIHAARVDDEAVTALDSPGVGATALGSAVEELSPDIAASDAGYRVVWSSNSAGSYRITSARLAVDGAMTGWAILTAGHDTWPSVATDPAQPGQYVVDFSRRTPGTGHYEVMSARFGNTGRLEPFTQLSTTDANMSHPNAESMRPALVAHASGAVHHVWARVRQDAGPGVAVRRSAALVDLTTTIAVSPARPSPARAGVNPADQVTVTVGYGSSATSSGRAPSRLTVDFPGFTVTRSAVTGPAVASGGGWDVPRMEPGASGTITLTGTMAAGAEGTIRTATAAVAATDAVVDDPALTNTATASVTLDHPLAVESVTRLDSSPTSAAVRWRVTFDQPVTGFDASDVVLVPVDVTDPTVTGITCAGSSCVVSARATGTGTLAVRVPASATATDPTGRGLATDNLPMTGAAYAIDTVAPAVTTTALGPDPTNADLIGFRLDFSEAVTAPAPGRLTVGGGAVSSVGVTGGGSGPAASWTVQVTPSGDGPVSVTPEAGAASDAAGNPSTAGNRASRTSDRTAPVLTLTGPTDPQRAAYDVVVSASEEVAALTMGDLVVSGGTAESLTGSGPWTVRVRPTAEGPVVLRVPAGSVADAAGNGNAAAASTTTYDATAPGVTVSSAAGERTGDNPIGFTLTFTEPVTGLDVDELAVSGGTATLSGSGATRTVLVVPAGEGPVSVAVPAGVASDAAGNTNTAGAAATRTYDQTGPTPQVTSPVTSPSNAASFAVTVTWPEDVTGFAVDDVQVVNGAVSDWAASGPRSWTFTLIPAADGTVRVSVPAGAAQDRAGNASLAATRLEVEVDRAAPAVTLDSSDPDPTNASSITVDVVFDEPVTGLSSGDFTATGATVSNLTGSSDTWTLTLSPSGEGPFGVRLPAGAVTDAAGNPNTASNTLSRTRDVTATAQLTRTGPPVVNAPIALQLTLSDDATIAPGDFVTTNGTVTSLAGGPRRYDVVYTPTADGPASVRLRAGAFTDAAGNTSSASAEVAVTYDATAPTVTGLRAPAWATAPYPVEVTFSEPVLSLATANIAVTNGVAGQASGAERDWTFVVTPDADGQVTVTVGADTARDAAGNASVSSGTVSTTYDTTAPTVTVTSPTAAVVTTSPIPVEIRFSEPVTGLDVDDFETGNATVTNLAGGGTRWTADLVPAAEGLVTLRVVAGAAADQTGHPTSASDVLSREFDSERPTLALTSPVSGVTTASTIPVTATFSKPVLGFEEDDLRTTGATVTDLTRVDARTWRFVLAVVADGEVSVRVPDNAAASAGGHLAFGATYSVTVDRTAPSLRVAGPASVTDDRPVVFDVVASESVTGLDEADLSVSGAARPGAVVLAQTSPDSWRVTVSGMTQAGDVQLAVRDGAVSDAAGNTSVRAAGQAAWRPSGRLRSFRLLQQPGSREGNRVSLPVLVRGSEVTFTARSSNGRLLPESAVGVTGSGATRQLTLAARSGRSGASTVVVTAHAGSTSRTIRVRLVVGGEGDERLRGGPGTDVMLAREGVDAMLGRGGDDHLYGGFGYDRLVGGAGDDLMVGGPGADELVGGAGSDVFVAWGSDRLVDVRRGRGDRVVRPSKAQRRLLGP